MLYAQKFQIFGSKLDIVFDKSQRLVALLFVTSPTHARFTKAHVLQSIPQDDSALCRNYKAITQSIQEYAEGKKRNVLPAREINACIANSNATSFEKNVWRAVLKIPYGTVTNYGQIAHALSMPHAARAVGNALAKNPLPLVVPCHRVVLQNHYNAKTSKARAVKNYSGGVAVKESLLRLEGAMID